MSEDKDLKDQGRRKFVRKAIVTGGVLAGGGILASNAIAQPPQPPQPPQVPTPPQAAPVPALGAVALAGLTVAVAGAATAELKRRDKKED